ncbi:MAG: extracellular solute-binding protein [Rhodospirillaceae bacterium]|nr:extracellular solute-binding protein [Rhodospirillaceae bacterium]
MNDAPPPDTPAGPPTTDPRRAARPTRDGVALILAARRTTRRVALALSAALVAAWAAYMALAPQPAEAPQAPTEFAAPEPAAPESADGRRAPARPALADAPLRLAAPAGLIDPVLLADFSARNGFGVRLADLAGAGMDIDAGGLADADVVLAPGPVIRALADEAGLAVLPLHLIPAAAQLDPGMTARAAAFVPDRFQVVPYAWETIGIGYDRAAVVARLGPSVDMETWSALFDPASAAKLAGCGLQTLDAPDSAFPAALAYLGRDPAGARVADIEAAAASWEAVKGFFTHFASADIADNLAAGTVCAAIAPSGQVYQARAAVRAAAGPGPRPDLAFAVPREGALLRLYLIAMPDGARAGGARTQAAAALIEYLLQPEVAARMTNQRWIANAAPRSRAFLRPEIQQDRLIYPDAAVMGRLTDEPFRSPTAAGLSERLWRLINASTRTP